MVLRLDMSAPGATAAFDALAAARRGVGEDADRDVAAIIADVRARGDAAVLEYTNRFDRLDLADGAAMRVTADAIGAARADCPDAAVEALELAARRIEDYHRRQMPEAVD